MWVSISIGWLWMEIFCGKVFFVCGFNVRTMVLKPSCRWMGGFIYEFCWNRRSSLDHYVTCHDILGLRNFLILHCWLVGLKKSQNQLKNSIYSCQTAWKARFYARKTPLYPKLKASINPSSKLPQNPLQNSHKWTNRKNSLPFPRDSFW